MNPVSLEIKRISANQAKELSELLLKSSKEYSKHFIPFEFDLENVSTAIGKANKDMFYGIYVEKKLIGFYMLRGWDAGFEVPSYGVWIAENYSSKGISKLTLNHAISICRINLIKRLMLKVHPDNLVAKKIYENFGFVYQGIDERIGHLIYFKDIK
ncbi:MAG: GNAT family N-acetyltransferase [Ignavibacterium sp.]|nr:GNAT family N-acetyltransferase [Ignavibacterium sp.]